MQKIFLLTFLLGAYSLSVQTKEKGLCSYEDFFQGLVAQDQDLKDGIPQTFSKTGLGDYWFWHERRVFIEPNLPALKEVCEKSPTSLFGRRVFLNEEDIPGGKTLDPKIIIAKPEWAREALYAAFKSEETITVEK